MELGASSLAAGCGAVVELGVGPLWSWVWGRCGAGCGAVVELGVGLLWSWVWFPWSWVWAVVELGVVSMELGVGCCGAGCGVVVELGVGSIQQ